MKDSERTFLNLLFTSVKNGAFPSVHLSNKVLVSYLELTGDQEELLHTIKSKYHGISKERFEAEDPLTSHNELLSKKIEALKNHIATIKSNSFRKIVIPFVQLQEIAVVQKMFDFYYRKTGQIAGEPVHILELDENNLHELSNMVQSICKDVIHVNVLKEVSDKLLFDDLYNPKFKKVVESPAIACSEVYYQLKSDMKAVDSDEIKKRVLDTYYFQIYSEYSQDEAKVKARRVVTEWIRKKKKKKSDFRLI